ncbi:hypothetical protein F8271_17165 [Micromonospora sp. ALFpr18c]|uniref:RICIN domain-containing protein n=1 Tax=unclassified Micromonospora TaxID=2617518 RepID=UPI00124AFDD5|nr:RICIN domain-containing protein [Micromonospora sp. ALFpr18c]KAB1939531.1 hypothetical protein F8271_17165 [Micromonospora sp. ALFpr18c]
MTSSSSQKTRWIRLRLPAKDRRRVVIAGLSLVTLGAGVLPLGGDLTASANAEKLVGKAVPAALTETIVAAALSCRSLNPARLSAQIMVASKFASDQSNGIAGLTAAEWNRWRPAQNADRGDSADNIHALAHKTCDLVGQVRFAGLTGDMWPLALAADKVGIDAVVASKGVPASAKSYVKRVKAYANWYAEQTPFRVESPNGAVSRPQPGAIRVPDTYVDLIRKAGSICPLVTAPRIAAQLMAMSKFDPKARSADGGLGIAQFTPDLWRQYGSSPDSVWKAEEAIPALGMAMCDYVSQLGGLSGADPYRMALAAFQWGEDAVRAANGTPKANVPQLSDATMRYVAAYEKDPRLTAGAVPSPSPSPGGPTTPSGGKPTTGATVPATPGGTTPAPGGPTTPAQEPTTPAQQPTTPTSIGGFKVGLNYQLINDWTGSVAQIPYSDSNKTVGEHVTLWVNKHQKDQFWKLTASQGYAVWVNTYSGLAMGIEPGGTWNGAKVLQVKLNPTDHFQQWKIENAGGGRLHIRNRATGKLLEILGADVAPTADDGTWNGHWLEQWDEIPGQRDQRWSLVHE